MSIKRYVVLYNDSAANTGSWIQLDTRYEDYSQRTLQFTVVSTDNLILEGTTVDYKTIDKSYLSTLPASDISTITTITSTGTYTLTGPWAYVRVRKTGTAGVGKAEGLI